MLKVTDNFGFLCHYRGRPLCLPEYMHLIKLSGGIQGGHTGPPLQEKKNADYMQKKPHTSHFNIIN